MTIGSMTVEERAIHRALADAGWHGAVEVEVTGPDDDPRVHVRWDGRHVEAVSAEAAAAYIRADAAAKVAAADVVAFPGSPGWPKREYSDEDE